MCNAAVKRHFVALGSAVTARKLEKMILKGSDRQFGSVGVFIVMLNVPPVIVVFENKQKDGTLLATKLEFWFDTFCEKAMST